MDFYKSERWTTKRKSILRRDNYQSALARRYGKLKPAEIVHHIFPRTEYPEYAFDDWNLISVTFEEHNRLHDRGTDDLTEYFLILFLFSEACGEWCVGLIAGDAQLISMVS